MPYYHRTEVMGALGATPTLTFTVQGHARTQFSVFVNEHFRPAATNERIQKTIIYNCTAFGPIAEQACQVLTKGTWVWVEGRMDPRRVDDGREFWNLKVDKFIRLDGRRPSEEERGQGNG